MNTLHCAVLLGMSSLCCANPVLAQAIAPAPDGTDTIVTLDSNRYYIDGGTQAGANLFHSFQEFGLSSGEIAKFLSHPRITNILGRVTGGDPSVINGLIQATPNLYLMNPAGIVFGVGASLNVGGDFLATTSDRIGFEGGWFNAMGANDYTTLIGNPNQFSFLSAAPSAIINAGTLTSNQDITLLGGTVIQAGAIAAPTVTLAAVPGSRLVNVAQAGMLLSLDLPQEALTAGISPMDLPSLLTAGGVELQGSIVTGDVHLIGQVVAEQADLFAAGRVTVDAPDLVSGNARVVRFSESGDNPDQAVFIDARADNPEALLFGAEAGTIAQIIDRDQNGMATITAQLSLIRAAVGKLDSVAIVAEGNQGNFWLGNQWINSENVENYQTQLQTWSDSLTEGADLLLYSCFTALGATGEALMASLAAITGADVAASTNLTGSSNYGGDWVLERRTGTIEAVTPFTDLTLSRWEGTLANQTVSNLNDAGAGSLRQALALVGNNESVTFSVSGTVNLLSTISWAQIGVTIDGNGSTVQGNNTFRIFESIATLGTTTINNLTIAGGGVTGSGGGIFSGSDLSLTNSTVSGNIASSGGGGIRSVGNVSLTNSTVSGNFTSNFDGGGIYSDRDVSLTNSTITGNAAGFGSGNGGGISSSGNVSLTNSTITGNSAGVVGGNGGGIRSVGDVSLINSTIAGNVAGNNGGGIWVQNGSLAITEHPGNLDLDLFVDNGAVALSALGDITLTGSVQTTGNPLTLNATQGIDTTALTLDTSSATGGGVITLNAAAEIQTRSLNAASLGTGNGGNVALISTNGTINTLSGTGAINTTSPTGNSGTVTLQAPKGIAVGLINTEATAGAGGAVTLESVNGFVRVPGAIASADSSFNSFNASIASAGAVSGGAIVIRHGGNESTPFLIGDATTNGTSAAITAGTGFTILPTQAYLTSHTQPGISILTNSAPPENLVTLPENPVTPPENPATPPEIVHAVSGSDVKNQFLDNEEFVRRVGRQLGGETRFDAEGGFTWSLPGEKALGGSLEDNAVLQELIRLDDSMADAYAALTVLADNSVNVEGVDGADESESDEGEESSIGNLRETFRRIQTQTGTNPALVYILSQPDYLELILITPDDQFRRHVIPAASREELMRTVSQFRRGVLNQRRRTDYVQPAQQLYEWMIAPLASTLDELAVDTLIFAMGEGLRHVPLAALYDGEQFLIEKYSLGQIPSLSLTNSDYQSLQDAHLLIMGASEFQALDPLPGVEQEASVLSQVIPSEIHLNAEFTYQNLTDQSRERDFDVVHLATHADFKAGRLDDSYIQLWGDEQLQPHELRELRWYDNPQVELLVLSACETALGDVNAELGFAGLAVQAGVKSALASLWQVSDRGTMALMGEFYRHLTDPEVTIKAEALRRAQLALIQQSQLAGVGDAIAGLDAIQRANFSHPFYWSAFMLVGSPW